MKTIRNILGAVWPALRGYVLAVSVKDVRRYIKNQHVCKEVCVGRTLCPVASCIDLVGACVCRARCLSLQGRKAKSKACGQECPPTLLLLQHEIGRRQHDHVDGAADQRQVRFQPVSRSATRMSTNPSAEPQAPRESASSTRGRVDWLKLPGGTAMCAADETRPAAFPPGRRPESRRKHSSAPTSPAPGRHHDAVRRCQKRPVAVILKHSAVPGLRAPIRPCQGKQDASGIERRIG